jgi:hypothetical protein
LLKPEVDGLALGLVGDPSTLVVKAVDLGILGPVEVRSAGVAQPSFGLCGVRPVVRRSEKGVELPVCRFEKLVDASTDSMVRSTPTFLRCSFITAAIDSAAPPSHPVMIIRAILKRVPSAPRR